MMKLEEAYKILQYEDFSLICKYGYDVDKDCISTQIAKDEAILTIQNYIDSQTIPKNKEVTNKYINMIEAFECDFALARDGKRNLNHLQQGINEKDESLLNDIKLLEELSFNLRHNKLKIVEVDKI